MVTLDGAEVAKHNTRDSCWIVVNNGVYDVTQYLSRHPGGAAIILKQAGSDATEEFSRVHSPDVLHHLPQESYLGNVDPSARTALSRGQRPPRQVEAGHEPSQGEEDQRAPHIAKCIVLSDFEEIAKKVLTPAAWVYASSSAHTGQSLRANLSSWQHVTFRPRVLRNVESVSTRTSILGQPSALPFFVAPMGALGRAHPGAENELVRGLARGGGVHCLLSAESTRTVGEIAASLAEEQRLLLPHTSEESPPPSQLHYQLYVPSDRSIAVGRIRRARAAGCKSLWVTVDTPVLGKRTADRRLRALEALSVDLPEDATAAGLGSASHVRPGELSAALVWDDLSWIREEWGGAGPIVLKGIQGFEDARLAAQHGVQGLLLSNHGGRQMHSAPDALTTLLEIRRHCPEVLEKLEIYVDGGLRDGADVLKALCLGARGVGVGRPFLYALAAYGMQGVERCIAILSDELRTGMRLLGVGSLDQLRPEMVNASHLLNDLWRPERSRL